MKRYYFLVFIAMFFHLQNLNAKGIVKWECIVSGYGVTSSNIPSNCTPDQTSNYQEAPDATPPTEENQKPRTFVFDTPQDLKSIQGSGRNGATVYLSDGDDNIDIKGADDVLYAGGGNDNIIAGTYFDIIDGGKGDDNINGGKGLDIIYGGSGNDTIDGGERNDSWQQTDTLVYVKPRSEYNIEMIGADTSTGATLRITDNYTGEVDEVKNIEQIAFGYSDDINNFDLGNFSNRSKGNEFYKNVDKYFDDVFLLEYEDGHSQEGQQNLDGIESLLLGDMS